MRLNHSWIDIKLLKHRKNDKIKELTDMINDTQQHQRNYSHHILGEIRSMQKSIEDLDSTVKENKDEIKSLMDRTKALETQNTQKDDKIKELTDEINNTQQHQRKFSIRIKGLHDQRNKKMKNS